MDKDEALERLESWESYYNKISNRTTEAYLNLLNSMRADYEKAGESEKCREN